MSSIKSKADYILKHSIKLNKLFMGFMSGILRMLGVFVKTHENSVIFSGHGRKYNDSPRKIYEYMMGQSEYKDMRFVWALENVQEDVPGDCIKVKTDTFRYFVETFRCHYWIACVNIERGLKYKKKKTVYLNTWHGTPLKTIGNAAEGRKDYDFSNIDYFCTAGEYESEIYVRDFNLRPESLINTGLPRNDELYHVTDEEIQRIRQRLEIPEGKKVILYAPTWRESKDGGKTYAIKPPIDFSLWEEKLGEQYIILLRTHPYTTSLIGVSFNDFVRDFTDYPEINDLLKAADILISDYSAMIFDYSILCKPIICFGYDYDSYVKERGLCLDLEEELPSGVLKKQSEVIDFILNMNVKEEEEKTRIFRDRFLQYGGNATEFCVKTIMNGGSISGAENVRCP